MESSQTRDGTHVPCLGRWIPNHWTIREIQKDFLFFFFFLPPTDPPRPPQPPRPRVPYLHPEGFSRDLSFILLVLPWGYHPVYLHSSLDLETPTSLGGWPYICQEDQWCHHNRSFSCSTDTPENKMWPFSGLETEWSSMGRIRVLLASSYPKCYFWRWKGGTYKITEH